MVLVHWNLTTVTGYTLDSSEPYVSFCSDQLLFLSTQWMNMDGISLHLWHGLLLCFPVSCTQSCKDHVTLAYFTLRLQGPCNIDLLRFEQMVIKYDFCNQWHHEWMQAWVMFGLLFDHMAEMLMAMCSREFLMSTLEVWLGVCTHKCCEYIATTKWAQ